MVHSELDTLENFRDPYIDSVIGEAGFDVITPAQYVSWVKRSLNRKYALRLFSDGRKGSTYRQAVRRFQSDLGLPVTGQVDASTQNAIIVNNEGNRSYLAWVQIALERVGITTKPPRTTATNRGSFKSTGLKLGIRAFQRREGLARDGFIGSKTETLLMQRCSCTPPGTQKKPSRPSTPIQKIDNVLIWFNAFIPNNLPKDITVKPFAGPFVGKVFLRSPSGFFATDQRNWSKRPTASSRMHVSVNILTKSLPVVEPTAIIRTRIGRTIRVNRFGRITCSDVASSKTIDAKIVSRSKTSVRLRLEGEGDNPCSPPVVTPAINFDLRVSVEVTPDREKASLKVRGGVDEFPSFEMYAAINGRISDSTTLFRSRASNDPFDLYGPPVRRVSVQKTLRP